MIVGVRVAVRGGGEWGERGDVGGQMVGCEERLLPSLKFHSHSTHAHNEPAEHKTTAGERRCVGHAARGAGGSVVGRGYEAWTRT